MTRRMTPGLRPRAGITLTEILISIFIMGIGMLSLATLFPLGLQRLREAARSSRSAMLIETATGEIRARDLFYPPSFRVNGYPFDPFTEDPANSGEATSILAGLDRQPDPGVNPGYYTAAHSVPRTRIADGTGLPICYDPMWWYQVYAANGGTVQPSLTPGSEFRFGSGIGSVRSDPDGGPPSAHGLQRITNFPLETYPGPPVAYGIDPSPLFASPDDLVMQADGTADVAQGRGSPLVPDLSTNARMYDFSYTWMFTGFQTEATKATFFNGDLVIFHNRPFSIEQRDGVSVAAGERVVEAIWGYSSVPDATGFGRSDRSVLLRWSNTQPDPDVRVGGWIADVTYERSGATEVSRFYPGGIGVQPAQRCFWYRITKRTEPTVDHELDGFREMIVTLGSDLRAKTALTGTGSAVHVNVALVSPYVVNVTPRQFHSK